MATKKKTSRNPHFEETEVTIIGDRLCIETIPMFMPGNPIFSETDCPTKEDAEHIEISILVKLTSNSSIVKRISYAHDCYTKQHTQRRHMSGVHHTEEAAKQAHNEKIEGLRKVGISNAWAEFNSGLRRLQEYGELEELTELKGDA